MQHTLVAVFDNRTDAQKALEELVACGFSRQEARLSEGDPSGQEAPSVSTTGSGGDVSIGASIKHFFSDIFGSDRSQHAQMYSDAVARGHYVLTVNAATEAEVERAADIVERYGPVDIDEHSEQWQGGGLAGAAGGAGVQQAQSMSQQSQQSQQSQPLQGGQGAAQSGAMSGQGSLQGSQQRAEAADVGAAIPVIQEELRVGKREVQRGGVRIYQRVVETPVTESIGLREEHLNVQRRTVDKLVDPADIPAFQEHTIELRETAEEAVVEKSARIVEEVIVGKNVTEREQKISDTLRHTEVEIEQLSADDDAYFRGHWTSNFANQGGSYDDYAPAYRYGTTMARNDLYRARQWNEVEHLLRTDWESRHADTGSTWDKMKAAVRHGWERITS